MEVQNKPNLDKNFNKPISFIVTGIIGLIITILVILYRWFDRDSSVTIDYLFWFSIISDGFYVAGVLIGGIGLLVLISGEGFFDIINYGFGIILKGFSKNKDHESYTDYKLRKAGERKDVKISFIAIVGGVYLVIAILCSIPFMF